MVGRELPNLRPLGEDHPGVGSGGMLRPATTLGIQDTELSRNWIATMQIYKALGRDLYGVIGGMAVMNFDLRV